MSRQNKDDLRIRGMSLTARFCLYMSLALAVVMLGVGFFLLRTTQSVIDRSLENAFRDTVQLKSELDTGGIEYEQVGQTAMKEGRFQRFPVRLSKAAHVGEAALLYRYDPSPSVTNKRPAVDLVVPARRGREGRKALLGLILGVTALVILVGAAVAYWAGIRVSGPIEDLVEDVRQISRGNFDHRTRVRGGGEVAILARSLDRMASSLSEAQDAQLELSVREREREVALEVSEALLPQIVPSVPGFAVGDLRIGSSEPGGDFYDYVESGDQVAVLVCEVSGAGVPGALVSATARAYLRNELERGGSLKAAFQKVNRDLARDVRRGMYVTALCVVLQPGSQEVQVVCAGHKLPLLRYRAVDRKVSLVQPEGIALGFDKGPVFDRSLQIGSISLAPGDRLVMATTAVVRTLNPDGQELGEKEFYRQVLHGADQEPAQLMDDLQGFIESFAGDEGLPADISIVAVGRNQ
ncbi:MAG: sigma-B regulation protein RsbU (phosphoserine phosphatase) [Chlamydiales bacterium]|jgi:sigma-B regulation protein RsbU (phosphoserine phosphatase)